MNVLMDQMTSNAQDTVTRTVEKDSTIVWTRSGPGFREVKRLIVDASGKVIAAQWHQ